MKAIVYLLLPLCFIATLQAQEIISPLPGQEEGKDATVLDEPMHNMVDRNQKEMLVHAWTELDAHYECELILKYDSTTGPYYPRIHTVTASLINTGSSAGTIMYAELYLESGLFLGPGQSPIIEMGVLLQPGDTTTPVLWIVRPIPRDTPANFVVGVTFFDSTGNTVVCRDSIDIPASPKVELTLNCSSDPTELVADPVRGGYVQDSVEIRLRINNTGELAVYDLTAAVIAVDPYLRIAGDSQSYLISRLDPGAPAVEATWLVKVAPRKTDDSACVLILVTGRDSTGSPIPTLECMVCIWIPKASDVTNVHAPPLADRIALEQNRPNPFNPVTAIDYTLVTDSHVRITVYDLFGRRIATLTDEHTAAGKHSVAFNGSGLPAGVYFYRLDAARTSVTKRMVMNR